MSLNNNIHQNSCSKMVLIVRTILFLLLCIKSVASFNIDVQSHVEYSRPPGTMFGFAVTAHKEGDTGW